MRRYEFGYIGVSLRYGYELLDAALERSGARYGAYRVEPVLIEMSIARLQREVVKGDLVNVVVRATNSRREIDEELIPIEIPLDKGLNGYRVTIIRASDQDRLARLGDIAGVRQLRIGIGEQWNDVPGGQVDRPFGANGSSFSVALPFVGREQQANRSRRAT